MEASREPHFGGLISSFERSCRARNLSPKTTRAYVRTAETFGDYCLEQGFPTAVEKVRRTHVEAFIADQLDGYKASTAATRFRCLQQFFRFVVEEEEIPASPMASMKPPLVETEPVQHLSDEDLLRIIKACEGREFQDRRDMAIVRLYLDTGMRREALATIDVADLDLDRRQVLIHTKGRKTLVVGFGDKTTLALDRYLRVRAKHKKAGEACLWLGPRGRFTGSGIYQMLDRRARLAGVGHVFPHQFRHTFAHRWMAAGGAESDLQNTLGWNSTQMVARYGASAKAERARAAADRLALGDSI